ncbi:ABC transporter permease [Candidatus Latescibacterota bacterium]
MTVVWKEWREFLRQRGTIRGTISMLLIPSVILGVLFPWQTGRIWVESSLSLATWVFVPIFIVATMIADSFAGERERNTLETLLASRLSDSTILYGKIAAAMCHALVMTFIVVTLGLLTVNIFHGEGELILFSFRTLAGGITVCILVACFASSAGVLVSLRAATVRQAQQTLSIAIVFLAFMPGIIIQMLPSSIKLVIGTFIESTGTTRIIITAFIVFLFLDLFLLRVARRRFRRTKLILDI